MASCSCSASAIERMRSTTVTKPAHAAQLLALGLVVAAPAVPAADVLLQQVQVYDGRGGAPFMADVRVHGTRITEVGPHLPPAVGEVVLDEHGLALAPGFIDAHSHADFGLFDDLDAATVEVQP